MSKNIANFCECFIDYSYTTDYISLYLFYSLEIPLFYSLLDTIVQWFIFYFTNGLEFRDPWASSNHSTSTKSRPRCGAGIIRWTSPVRRQEALNLPAP